MKIAFNMTSIGNPLDVTGVGQHQFNIVKGLMNLNLEKKYVFIVNEELEAYLKERYPNINTYNYGKQNKWPKIIDKYYFFLNSLYLDQYIVKKAVKKINPDIIFHPFNNVTIKTKCKKPVVTMVLDMYHRFHKSKLSSLNYKVTVIRHNAIFKHSHTIITSSNVNKKHIKIFYPNVLDERIKVIPVPIDINPNIKVEYKTKNPYILCVNSLRYHKNTHTLIKAFNLIKDKVKFDLILIGQYSYDEENNIKNQSERIIFTGYISLEQRNFLYENALLFISPTMFEGFGMTPLEAMVFKTKVLVSGIEVMRESTFNKAFYADDITNEHKLAKRILEVLKIQVSEKQLNLLKDEVFERYNPNAIAAKIDNILSNVERR